MLADMVGLLQTSRLNSPPGPDPASFLEELRIMNNHTAFTQMPEVKRNILLGGLLFAYVATDPKATGALGAEFRANPLDSFSDFTGSVNASLHDEPYHQPSDDSTSGHRYAPGKPAWNNMVQSLTDLLTEPDKPKAITNLAILAIDASDMIAETGMIKQRFADTVDSKLAQVDELQAQVDALKAQQVAHEQRLKDLQTTSSPPSPRQWLTKVVNLFSRKSK